LCTPSFFDREPQQNANGVSTVLVLASVLAVEEQHPGRVAGAEGDERDQRRPTYLHHLPVNSAISGQRLRAELVSLPVETVESPYRMLYRPERPED
jgi:hypothetical protein